MITLPRTTPRLSGRPSRPETGPIGLALAEEAVHVAQLSRRRGKLKMRGLATLPYPESREALLAAPRELKRLVRAALRAHGLTGGPIATVLPPEEVKLISVNYTVRPGQGEGAALAQVVGERLGGDLAEYVVDFVPVRDNDHAGGERTALVAVAKEAVVIPYLEAFRRAGLKVAALEIGPVAIRRLVSVLRPEGDFSNVLVINFGRIKSYLTVLSGRRLLFDREIAFGEERLLHRLTEALNLAPAAAAALIRQHGLAPNGKSGNGEKGDLDVATTLVEILKPAFLECVDAIQQILIYTLSETHGRSVEQIYLLGSIARWPGADRLLNSLVEMAVSNLDPVTPFATDAGRGEPDAAGHPQAAIAVGLALRGMVDDA